MLAPRPEIYLFKLFAESDSNALHVYVQSRPALNQWIVVF